MSNATSAPQLARIIMDAAEVLASEHIAATMTMFADEVHYTAPKRTHAMANSARAESTGRYTVEFRILYRARPIELGHKVAGWGTTKHPARKRRYKTRGYVAANPFMALAARQFPAPPGVPTNTVTIIRQAIIKAIQGLRP